MFLTRCISKKVIPNSLKLELEPMIENHNEGFLSNWYNKFQQDSVYFVKNVVTFCYQTMTNLTTKIENDAFLRSSRPDVFHKKGGVLRNFAKFTRKHLCQRLFFNKTAHHRPATLFKKSLWHRCFPVNFANFLRITFFREHFRWQLLFSQRSRTQLTLTQSYLIVH